MLSELSCSIIKGLKGTTVKIMTPGVSETALLSGCPEVLVSDATVY